MFVLTASRQKGLICQSFVYTVRPFCLEADDLFVCLLCLRVVCVCVTNSMLPGLQTGFSQGLTFGTEDFSLQDLDPLNNSYTTATH